MDKDQAKFILRSFRPDGGDARDPDFAAALQLAMQDRELGEWFARERATDADFSNALGSVEIPDSLRNEILDALAWQRGDMPHAESPEDEAWAKALATITPPPGMRENILAAMHACAPGRRKPMPAWKKFGIPTAAAAAVAFAFAMPTDAWKRGSGNATANTGEAASIAPMPIDLVRAGFINIFQDQEFTLDLGRASHREIMRHLEERGLPCPSCIPPGLRNIKGIGCREIDIDGRRGTVVCYEHGEGGLVHLVIFRAEDIEGTLPYRRNAEFAQHGDWAEATWRNNENAFVLLGNTTIPQIASLF